MKKITVAIDGYSSCGKSTMAKALARQVGYAYIDTGAMYRCVGLYALTHSYLRDGKVDESSLQEMMSGIQITFRPNSEGRSEPYLNGVGVESQIRTLAISEAASVVSQYRYVRSAMVSQQQAMGQSKGVVMDGRDIGTVVFPDAELKIFVTASDEVRARRRYDELVAKGEEGLCYENVLAMVRERDYRDTHRAESPLVQAEDALVLDNSHMTIEEQNEWLLAAFERAVRG